MSSITETAQLIANMAQTHITDAIISAVKGKGKASSPSQMKMKKSNKKTEYLSLADEILACFNMREFAEVAAANLEKLFKRKFEIDVDSDEPSTVACAADYADKCDSEQDDALMQKKMERVTEEVAVAAADKLKAKKPRGKKAVASETDVTTAVEKPVAEKKPRGKKATAVETDATAVEKPVAEKKPRAKKTKVSSETVSEEQPVTESAAVETPSAVDNNKKAKKTKAKVVSAETPVESSAAPAPIPASEEEASEQTPTDDTQETSKTKKSNVKKVFIVVNEEDKKVKKVFQKEKKVKGKKSTEEETFTENSSDAGADANAAGLTETTTQNVEPIESEPENIAEKINEQDNASVHTADFRDIPLNITNELEEDLLSEISAWQ